MIASIPEWLTAIGTVSAVVLVLFKDWFIKIYRRPKLITEFSNSEPYCRYASENNIKKYWMRLRIKNIGRSIAKGCEVKLVRIINPKTQKEAVDFDPVTLHWVGHPRSKNTNFNM